MSHRRCDAGMLHFGGGLEVLLNSILDAASPGDVVDVLVSDRAAALEMPGWARLAGHEVTDQRPDPGGAGWLTAVRRGPTNRVLAPPLPEPADHAPLRRDGFHLGDWRALLEPLPEAADPTRGFAPLGAIAEAGAPDSSWQLNRRDQVWVDEIAQLTEGASAAQWDASRDIPWSEAGDLPVFLEQAVCQVVTFLAQNEYAAYFVPARFLGKVNPAYTEVLLWLASHVHDEARHVEVFTKRGLLNGAHAYALASTERSLQSLLEEPDFTASALLLNVLGEGSFVDLLQFIADHAPDAATATAASLAHRDELRHVAFGIGHLRVALAADPGRKAGLLAAAEARSARLVDLTGLNPLITEALTVMAAASMQPAQLSEAAGGVQQLMTRMADNRVLRLQEAGFDTQSAQHLSDLHTPNLM